MQVPEPRFYLKNPASKEYTLISMQSKYCGERVFISTGEKVIPSNWDFDRQRVMVNKKDLSASTTNLFLDRIVSEFKAIFRELLITYDLPRATLVTDKLLEKIDASYVPIAKEEEKITFFKFIETYIEECKTLKSVETVKIYSTTLNHLKKYAAIEKKQFDFDDITLSWRSGFIKYLHDINSATNTVGKQIQTLKTFLNEATERKINTNLEFRSRLFSKPNEDVEKVFLDNDELKKISELDLSKEKKRDIVRDYYLISCYTSLRYSDFSRIRPENIKGNTIELQTNKTSEGVIIPIHPIVKGILYKYNNFLPKCPCNQVFNLVLKDVCRLAGITEKVTVTKTIAGVKQSKTYEKYELISCHTGRRTMISNAILEGVSTSSIMLISAHKSLKVFQKYVRITKQQNADALANHKFFKNEPPKSEL
ncbi:MAG TPA: site-specific integrase [Ferruginibacter sp.]|jgi:site-specific recombinase XerD|nr:site-specific integrase [Ferruginibacter sp.]